MRFAALADVGLYRDHPRHRAWVETLLAPRMDVIMAWNFEVA